MSAIRNCAMLASLSVGILFGLEAKAADTALVEAARKEGTVVWYTAYSETVLARPMAAAFEKKYPGVKVEVVAGQSQDLGNRVVTEFKSGGIRADVQSGLTAMFAVQKVDGVQPYHPEAAKALAPELRDPNGMWSAASLYFLVAAVNTELVPEGSEPKTYEDLLDPKWKGKMAWAVSLGQSGPAAFIGTILDVMGPEKGMEYLKQLAEQDIANIPSNQRVVLDQVISGEYAMGLMTYSFHSAANAAVGAPVKWLKLEPVVENIDAIFLLKGPHPNAGKLFIEFVLSEEGQQQISDAGYLPAHPDVLPKRPELSPQVGKFSTAFITPDRLLSELPEWVKIYNELFRK